MILEESFQKSNLLENRKLCAMIGLQTKTPWPGEADRNTRRDIYYG